MPVEIVGQQLRIRVREPSLFIKSSFRTQSLGEKGRLQRITSRLKSNGKWDIQSWHLNLNNYNNINQIIKDINATKVNVAKTKQAIKLAKEWASIETEGE